MPMPGGVREDERARAGRGCVKRHHRPPAGTLSARGAPPQALGTMIRRLLPAALLAAALLAPAAARASGPADLQPALDRVVAAGAPGVLAYVDDGRARHGVWQGAA